MKLKIKTVSISPKQGKNFQLGFCFWFVTGHLESEVTVRGGGGHFARALKCPMGFHPLKVKTHTLKEKDRI